MISVFSQYIDTSCCKRTFALFHSPLLTPYLNTLVINRSIDRTCTRTAFRRTKIVLFPCDCNSLFLRVIHRVQYLKFDSNNESWGSTWTYKCMSDPCSHYMVHDHYKWDLHYIHFFALACWLVFTQHFSCSQTCTCVSVTLAIRSWAGDFYLTITYVDYEPEFSTSR